MRECFLNDARSRDYASDSNTALPAGYVIPLFSSPTERSIGEAICSLGF